MLNNMRNTARRGLPWISEAHRENAARQRPKLSSDEIQRLRLPLISITLLFQEKRRLQAVSPVHVRTAPDTQTHFPGLWRAAAKRDTQRVRYRKQAYSEFLQKATAMSHQSNQLCRTHRNVRGTVERGLRRGEYAERRKVLNSLQWPVAGLLKPKHLSNPENWRLQTSPCRLHLLWMPAVATEEALYAARFLWESPRHGLCSNLLAKVMIPPML